VDSGSYGKSPSRLLGDTVAGPIRLRHQIARHRRLIDYVPSFVDVDERPQYLAMTMPPFFFLTAVNFPESSSVDVVYKRQ
jgi:hypothetical protein